MHDACRHPSLTHVCRQQLRMHVLHTAHKLENPRSKHKPGMGFQQGNHLKTSTPSLPSLLQWKH